MRILVAGGQGQIGSALALMGRERGLDLFALGRSELDITNVVSIASAFEQYQPELLINAAAYTAVDKAEANADLAYAINESATAMLADVCAAAKIPMLHISTDYVFDGAKEELYTEGDPVNPLSVYGKSKEAGERALRARIEKHIILRTSWVFGVHGNNFVKTIVHLAKDRDRLTVVEDQFGGPSSARSIADALLTIAVQYDKTGEVSWGTYHYCQKPYVSWHQFAQAIIQRTIKIGLIDHPVEVVPVPSTAFPTLATRPASSKLDPTKIKATFGIDYTNWYQDIDQVLKQKNIFEKSVY